MPSRAEQLAGQQVWRRPRGDNEINKVRQLGGDPGKVLIDQRTGDVWRDEDVPGPNYLTENIKSVIEGAASIPILPLRALGGGWDALKSLAVGDNKPSALTKSAQAATEFVEDKLAFDPRREPLATVPGQVVGQALGMLGGGLAMRALGLGAHASKAAIGTSAALTAGDTMEEEQARAARENEEFDPAKAAAKAALVSAAGGWLENKLGLGKFFRSLDDGASSKGAAMLSRAAQQAPVEAGQELGQFSTVEEEFLPKGWGERTLAGALGGTVGGGIQGAVTPVKPKAERDLSAFAEASKPATPPVDVVNETAAIIAAQTRGDKDWEVAGPRSPLDNTINDLFFKKRIPATPEIVAELYGIAQTAKDPAALQRKAREISIEYTKVKPAPAVPTEKLIEQRREEIQKVEKQFKELEARRGKILAGQQKAMEAAATPGAQWATAAQFQQLSAQELAQIDAMGAELVAKYNQLVNQIGEFERQSVVTPLAEAPVIAAQRQLAPAGDQIVEGQIVPRALLPAQASSASYVDAPAHIGDVNRPAIPLGEPLGIRSWQNVGPRPAAAQQAMSAYAEEAGLSVREGEQRVPFVMPGSLINPATPEPAATVAVQLQLTADPHTTKAVTLITDGSGVPADLPAGLEVEPTPHGLAVFHPAKTTRERVRVAGSGKVFDGSLLGYGTAPSETPGTAAVTTEVAGQPALAEVVRNEQETAAAIEAQQAATAGQGETKVAPAADVIQQRMMALIPPGVTTTLRRLAESDKTLAARGYALTGVAELQREKPFGLTLSAEAELPVGVLKNKMASVVPKGELDAYIAAGLDDFLAGKQRVGKNELQAWLQENGPQVEVLELRPRGHTQEEQAIARAVHELESMGIEEPLRATGGFFFNFNNDRLWYDTELDTVTEDALSTEPYQQISFDVAQAVRRYAKARDTLADAKYHVRLNDATIGKYGVEPRRVEDLVEPVELLVKVPKRLGTVVDISQNADGTYTVHDNVVGNKPKHFKTYDQAKLYWNNEHDYKWTGGHHGNSGRNALGFARASVETLPDGRRGLHLFEVQSDWGGIDKIRTGKDKGKFSTSDGEVHETFAAAELHNQKRHPLLADYNRLVLKAAIKYAVDNDLQFIAVSDPETTMMTEKHHSVAGMIRPVELAEVAEDFNEDYQFIVKRYGTDWKNGRYVKIPDRSVPIRIDDPDKNGASYADSVRRAYAVIDAGYGDLKPGDDPVAMPIPQERGMRENYGKILPRLLSQLTGSPAEPVEFAGEHQNYDAEVPAFNNKKTITANAFSLDLSRALIEDNYVYSLFGADRINPAAKQLQMRLLPDLSEISTELQQYLNEHNLKLDTALPARVLYAFTQGALGVTSRLAPLGTYYGVLGRKLFIKRNAVQNKYLHELQKFLPFLKDERTVDWMLDAHDNKNPDVSKLPKDLQPAGAAWINFIQSFPADMIQRGQYVWDPVRNHARLPEVIAGYFPWAIDDKVYKEMNKGGALLDKWENIWTAAWTAHTHNPDVQAAKNHLYAWAGPLAQKSGDPLDPKFAAARRVHGMDIPREMRSRNLVAAMERYIDRFAEDTAFTEVVQKNPLGRRAFGVTMDEKFQPVDDGQVQPSRAQWADIFREAERYDSPWLAWAKPGMNIGMPVDKDDVAAQAFRASFLQQPLAPLTGGVRWMNTANTIAGSLVLQTASGIRDTVASGMFAGEYLQLSKVAGEAVNALADYAAARDAALAAGAFQTDVFKHQAAGIVSEAVYKATRAVRRAVGRQILDEYPRVFTYHAAVAQVKQDYAKLGSSPLANEFATAETREGGSVDDIAAETAAMIVDRVAPSYTAANLPPGLVPQTANWIGYMIGLSRWGVARYNVWYEDSLLPALKEGSPDRLMRSLFLGIIGGAGVNALLDWLRNRKPANLSWQEWFGLSSEEQVKQAAPMLFSTMQLNGTLGVLGDIAAPVTKVAARSGPVRIDDFEPALPSFIIAKNVILTATSWANYVDQKGIVKAEDLMDLGVELSKNVQVIRDVSGWLDENGNKMREIRRELKMFEKLQGESPRTGDSISQPLFELSATPAPFSMSRKFNEATGEELNEVSQELLDSARHGKRPPNVMQHKYTKEFWQDIERRRGREKAEELYRAAEGLRQEDNRRRRIATKLRSVAEREDR